MTQWMLVSRDWLKIVLFVVFRDLWITRSPTLSIAATTVNPSYANSLEYLASVDTSPEPA
ncbi:hypothetical protein B0H16DRAFT_1886375, partial [Mycena metata]